ncbi:MAG: hypothetical protein GC182_09600 [Rhodopseudomonas sp.]|nr:hypothetical protein [Rhodopseudomonas sp.]
MKSNRMSSAANGQPVEVARLRRKSVRGRGRHLVALAVLIAIAPAVSGCADFDMDKLDVFHLNDKKKLPGERVPLFPDGVPGVTQGIPAEYMKGREQEQPGAAMPVPTVDSAAMPAATGADTAKAEPKPEPKPAAKPKPKRIVKRKPKPKPQPPAEATAAPATPAAQPAPAPAAWPAPAPAQTNSNAASQPAPWPASPPPGTFTR